MEKLISFKFSGLSGDVVHYMAGIKAVCEDLGKKADLYLWLDRQMISYEGAQHPYGTSMINQYAFDMLKPLLEKQTYINSVQPWQGQVPDDVIVDMDKIRQVQVGMPYGSLTHWMGNIFADMQGDFSEPWFICPDHTKFSSHDPNFKFGQTILINRTSRYHNEFISYFFLKDYKNLMFTGLPAEHEAFCKSFNLDIPLLTVNDFLDLAWHLYASRFFIGNQSMCYAIAEAMKVPRLLEMCPFAPNIFPMGREGRWFRYQEGLVHWVKTFNAKYPEE